MGCDGGSRRCGKPIGAKLEGTPVISACSRRTSARPASRHDPRQAGLVVLLGQPSALRHDVRHRRPESWLVHNHLNPDEPEFDSVDRDRRSADPRRRAGVRYEVISRKTGSAGDSSPIASAPATSSLRATPLTLGALRGLRHQAGIADAVNLSWLLAARLQGWGEEAILDAYEASASRSRAGLEVRDGPRPR